MTIYKKTFRPGPPAGSKGPPLSSPNDNKRTFDARPKPSDDRRREERLRPQHHIDPVVTDPLDATEEQPEDEA